MPSCIMTYYGEILLRYTRCGNNPRPSPPLSNEPFFFLSRDSHELQSSFILSHCPGCFSSSTSLRNAVVSFLFNPDSLPTTRLLFSRRHRSRFTVPPPDPSHPSSTQSNACLLPLLFTYHSSPTIRSHRRHGSQSCRHRGYIPPAVDSVDLQRARHPSSRRFAVQVCRGRNPS